MIAEKFNTYQFTEYKETVIELLERVCMVSVETIPLRAHVKIVKEMPERGLSSSAKTACPYMGVLDIKSIVTQCIGSI